jgi:hypothetical protein
MTRYLGITIWQLRTCFCGAPSLTRGRVCLLYMLLGLSNASFLGSESLVLAIIFYSLRFETSHVVASYDSQGHGGGIRPRLHSTELFFITTLHGPRRKEPLYCSEGVFTAPLHSNGSYSIVACVFVAAGMCYVAMNVYSDFAIPAFGRHVTVLNRH